ncbi:hypothetical protein SAMN05444172_2390 [Burkholderia sp. GAS332]|nr:hypothetical protein SAMN05444172_2390 [Burkholderia sp. GAS332]
MRLGGYQLTALVPRSVFRQPYRATLGYVWLF